MLYLYYLFALFSLHKFILLHQVKFPSIRQTRYYASTYDSLYDYNDLLNTDLDKKIFPNLGPYAVRYTTTKESPLPPKSCTIDVVNSLERHGARLMTPGALLDSKKTLKKLSLALANVNQRNLPSELRFLKYVTISSDTSSLTPYGALQAYYSGKSTAAVYSAQSRLPPFVRASGDEEDGNDRVIITAQFWLLGFQGGSFPVGTLRTHTDVRNAAPTLPRPNVILSEKESSNNTLDVSTCFNDNEIPTSQGERGAQSDFAKSTIVQSVGRRLANRLNVSDSTDTFLEGHDLLNLAQLCSFETLKGATIHDGLLLLDQSPFCNVFNHTEWEMLGYAFDVGKWRGFGYGNIYHRAVATGYLRELVARFIGRSPPLEAPTSLNTTIDGDENRFPLPDAVKGPVIYFDGSHDNNIAPIIASLGLFDGPKLHTGHDAHLQSHKWSFGQIAPFQGKIVIEKLSCTVDGDTKMSAFVRIRANGSIMRDWCKVNATLYQVGALCPLNVFIKMISFAQGDIEWKKCYN